MKQITITRALAELKLLDSKISKTLRELKFVDISCKKHEGTALKSGVTIPEFEKSQKALYQKLIDLIDFKASVKTAINVSNSQTAVKIAGIVMSIAQALEEKRLLPFKKDLLSRMKQSYNGILSEMEKSRATLDSQLQNLILSNTGKDKKVSKDDYDAIAKPFLDANTLHKVDPLKIADEIAKLEEFIDTFESDIDIVLSESNSQTMIDLE